MMTPKTNRELVLDIYESIAEASYPSKGAAARQIVEGAWDAEAANFVDAGRLGSMGYLVDNRLAINCVRGIVQRHPAINERLKSLKA